MFMLTSRGPAKSNIDSLLFTTDVTKAP